MRPVPRRFVVPLTLGLLSIPACDGPAPGEAPRAPSATSASASAARICPEPQTELTSIVRFRRDGVCLPSRELVLYRCSGSDVPALRLDEGSRSTTYLGGPFAVPVEDLPANVRFVGTGRGNEVLVADPIEPARSPAPTPTPSSPAAGSSAPAVRTDPLVFVRRDGATERWLRLPKRQGVAEPPVLWLIGDSIMEGGRDVLTSSLAEWALTLDAEVGRPSSEGVELAAAAVAQAADVVVVELGTNDVSTQDFRAHLEETLDLLHPVPLVVWQTARGLAEHPTIPAVNEAIRDQVSRYANTVVADWESFVPAEALMEDGIHPREGFESLESELLTPILTTWRAAISGGGPTSCARDVLGSAA